MLWSSPRSCAASRRYQNFPRGRVSRLPWRGPGRSVPLGTGPWRFQAHVRRGKVPLETLLRAVGGTPRGADLERPRCRGAPKKRVETRGLVGAVSVYNRGVLGPTWDCPGAVLGRPGTVLGHHMRVSSVGTSVSSVAGKVLQSSLLSTLHPICCRL